MANEGVIKVQYALTGKADITAAIYKPDDTIRDSQTAEALDDSGHAGLYTNSGAITIEPGDNVIVKDGALIIGGGEYQPEVTVANVADCKADVSGVLPSTPVNIEHSSEQITRQAASTLTVDGTVTRTSEPEVIA